MENKIKLLEQENKELISVLMMVDEYLSGQSLRDPELLKEYVKKSLTNRNRRKA